MKKVNLSLRRTRELSLLALIIASVTAPAQAAPVYFSVTGHSYDIILGSFSWDGAKAGAEAQSYNGMNGYLATLTSAEEDTFIRTNFSSYISQYVGPWFGASWDGSGSGPTEGWSWVTGEPFSYTGWNLYEPNHSYFDGGYENAIHFSLGGWNDILKSRTDAVGYLVEYNTGLAPVPEPATMFLLGFGLAGLAGLRLRMRRK